MTYKTRRRLRRDVEALRIELDRAREATKKALRRIDDLKLVIRDTAEQRDLAETHKTNLSAQLDSAAAAILRLGHRGDRYQLAWWSARERAAELRHHHDLAADELDDHAPAVEINHELAAHLPLEANACWGDP